MFVNRCFYYDFLLFYTQMIAHTVNDFIYHSQPTLFSNQSSIHLSLLTPEATLYAMQAEFLLGVVFSSFEVVCVVTFVQLDLENEQRRERLCEC